MKEKIHNLILEKLKSLDLEILDFSIEYPPEFKKGDYSTNVAMVASKKAGISPVEFAEKIVSLIKEDSPTEFEKIEIAGPGFINFYLSRKFVVEKIKEAVREKKHFGMVNFYNNKKVVVEYTDPNPFKEIHIGHLMSNTIGESIARLYEWSGAEVKRACYQGDVGMHVASAIWGMKKNISDIEAVKTGTIKEKGTALGRAYATGATALKADENVKKEIVLINKKVYERSDNEINTLYDLGREWSLEYFEEVYKKLGTKFDFYFFESETGSIGKELVLENLENGIFEKSDGATVFKGEKYGLHTRVFINSEGLPTYEAKELGLAKVKFNEYPFDKSIVVTGNEINDYFKVLLMVLSLIFPEIAERTEHVSHGMLRLPTGKMSSRTGDVITAEGLIREIEEKVYSRIKLEKMTEDEKKDISEKVAIAALKYSILKQSMGKDIIFDLEKSVSFEGDSGPYLQYTAVRASSILMKAEEVNLVPDFNVIPDDSNDIEKMLVRFPEVISRATQEKASNLVATYLIELASAFNTFYGTTKIIGGGEYSAYYLAVTEAVENTIKNGLRILGIETPSRM